MLTKERRSLDLTPFSRPVGSAPLFPSLQQPQLSLHAMLPGTAAPSLAGLFLPCPVISLNDDLFHRKIDLGIRPSFSWPLQQPILVPCSAVKGKWTRLLDLSRMSGCEWEEEGNWALVWRDRRGSG